MKIALAFSGGGVRATVFHLGVLARLARQDLLGNVTILSSVSGGSLAAGLVFSTCGYRWPNSHEYLHDVVPRCLSLLTTKNVQRTYVLRSLLRPWRLLSGRASVLGDAIESHWGITGSLGDLPIEPRWIINATCYQTGKNWRFQRDLMGDYQAKYIPDPEFRLSHALAASAAVPGLIGPLLIRSRQHRWCEYQSAIGVEGDWQPIEPKYRHLHLWDGGVYDNLGVESLFKPGDGLCDEADFLIVCDASRPLSSESRQSRWRPGYLKASMRLVDVATDQVRSLRARMLIEYFKQNPGTGAYLRLGSVATRANARGAVANKVTLSDSDIQFVAQIETTLRRLSGNEFSLLFRHGFEIADTMLSNYGNQTLARIPRDRVLFKAA
ncbi:MAG: patatin-like phospholipase family protein [Pirellulaceae bacterium]|nr:patatin-like phospholipase family protein [Pirellulaceae bacterium]